LATSVGGRSQGRETHAVRWLLASSPLTPGHSAANAINFSGIGTIKPVDDNGAKQKEYVVYRGYVEDRSEPGGFYPEGAVEPADIYCFQAWKTGILATKKPDFTTISTAFRTALGAANCDFLAQLEPGQLPIGTLPLPTVNGATADMQDCCPLYNGNEQIHKTTGAACTQSQ